MALNIQVEVQGRHSTPVDEGYYLQILREALASIVNLQDCAGRLILQLRAVRVRRGKRAPGIYVIGYNVHAPHSIELLCFSDDDTGRPATLLVGDDYLIALILRALAPNLYLAWSNSLQEPSGSSREHMGMKPQKAMRRARQGIQLSMQSRRSFVSFALP